MKSKKNIVIRIESSDLFDDIFKALEIIQEKEVFLLFPKIFPGITKKETIAKFQKIKHKNIVIILTSGFKRSILEKKGIQSLKQLPNDIREDLPVGLSTILNGTSTKTSFTSKEISGKAKTNSLLRSIIFFGLIATSFILSLVFFLITPHATLTLVSNVKVIPLNQNIVVALPNATIPDAEITVPNVRGIFMKTNISETQVFPSTGKAYELTNASGQISLLNETSEEKYLVPSRLMTHSGEVFRFRNDVIIPPKTGDKPGSVQIQVFADEYDTDGEPIGRRGNIEAGTELFFPALREELQNLYKAIANRGPLVGGSTLTRYFMSPDDPLNAKKILQETLTSQGLEILEQEVQERSRREKKKYIMISDPLLQKGEITQYIFPEEKIGQEHETFEVAGTASVSAIVFDQDEVISAIQKILEKNQDERRRVLSIDPLSINYRIIEREKFEEEQWIKVSVSLKAIEVLDLNSNEPDAAIWRQRLVESIIGKSPDEAESILANDPEIDKVLDVKIKPFWAKNIPKLVEQVELKLKNRE